MKIDFDKYKQVIKSHMDMDGWWGMNHEAAKALEFPDPIPTRYEIFVSDGISQENRPRLVRHEIIECELIHQQGMSYLQAHAIANKLEKFTQNQINEKLPEYIK